MALDGKGLAVSSLRLALLAGAIGASPLAVKSAYDAFVPEGSLGPALARALDDFQEKPVPKPTATVRTEPRPIPAGEPRIDHVLAAARSGEVGCRVPRRPEAHERIVAFSAQDGAKMAPYSLAEGARTDLATVTVEPGTEMLYLVLASHRPMAWRIAGARERVAHVVATATFRTATSGLGEGGSGVTGIAPANVSFMPDFYCLRSFRNADGAEGAEARRQLQAMLGRAPEFLGAAGTVASVSVPSLRAEEHDPLKVAAAPGFGDPGGPVVTPVAPVAYPPFQGDLGVEQLALAGKLTALPTGADGTKAYRVNAPLRMPQGMSPTTRLVLGDSVQMPEGLNPSTCVRTQDGLGLTPSCRALDDAEKALTEAAAKARAAAAANAPPPAGKKP